jgi:hypothetical protein
LSGLLSGYEDGITSQKIVFFIVTAIRTSNPITFILAYIYEGYHISEYSGVENIRCLPQYRAWNTVIFIVTAIRTQNASV